MIFGKTINRYYLKHLPVLLVGLLALIGVDIAQLVIPELYRMVINGINDGKVEVDGSFVPFDLDFLLDKICLPMILIIVALVIGRFLWRICFFGSAIRVETDLRKRMFDRSEDMPEEYYETHKVGAQMSLFTNDIETVQDCFGSGILLVVDAVGLGILAVRKMAKMDWRLTLLSMIPMALLLLSSTVVGKYMTKKWEKRQEMYSELSDFAEENFSGIAVVKAFVKEAKELSAFRRLNRKNEDANVDYVKMSTLFNITITLFVSSVMCIILGYGGTLVYNGVFNAGELVEFIGYFDTVIWPVMAVSEIIEMSSQGRASLGRIDEVLNAVPAVWDKDGVKPLPEIRGEIEFCHCTFRYPAADHDNLIDVNCKINAGENVGIIGKTGSGKTTLADLILRTYNVGEGMLKIDGVDVNLLPIKQVRGACAYVPQDNFLFSDTIENNIAFYTDDIDEEKVKEAAKDADIHDNIMEFEDGYKTKLGERGVTVSGGQKQRISIARALMKDAPILILDDAVSAVDTATEKHILESLKEKRKGKTTLLVAHRVSSVQYMDRIIYMERGKILAIGTHEELLKSCEAYKNTVALQKLEERVDM